MGAVLPQGMARPRFSIIVVIIKQIFNKMYV